MIPQIRNPSWLPQSFALVLVLAIAPGARALDRAEWKFSQALEVENARPMRVAAPLEILGQAQPDLRDLRVVGPDSQEVPFAVEANASPASEWVEPRIFKVQLSRDATVVSIESETLRGLAELELISPGGNFLKSVRIEVSGDSLNWTTVAEGAPFFHRDGIVHNAFPLDGVSARWIRATIDDGRQAPIVVTGARIRVSPAHAPEHVPCPVKIVQTEESAGETVITAELPAANVWLESIELSPQEKLYSRTVKVSTQAWAEGELREEVLGQTVVYGLVLEGGVQVANRRVPLGRTVPTKTITLRIENGDSPPLTRVELLASRRPNWLVLAPRVAGRLSLLAGNPLAQAPRYDWQGLEAQWNQLPVESPQAGELETNANYRQTDPLAGLVLAGGDIDQSRWNHRRKVHVNTAGVNRLELDLPVWSGARNDLGDLRLVRAGRQVPFVLERTGLSRVVTVPVTSDPDRQRSQIGRWKVELPGANLPLQRLILHSPAALFQRRVELLEERVGEGRESPRVIGAADWVRQLGAPSRPLTLSPGLPPETSLLWIETDNGENPPLQIDRVEAVYPRVRMLFIGSPTDEIELIYGNESATTPRYDLGLVAERLLRSEKVGADLEPASSDKPDHGASLRGAGTWFWVALAVVVAALLAVVARLLPKAPAK